MSVCLSVLINKNVFQLGSNFFFAIGDVSVGIGASIRIGREIRCPLYAGFFYHPILYLFCEIFLGFCLVGRFIVCGIFVVTNSFNFTSLFLPWTGSL